MFLGWLCVCVCHALYNSTFQVTMVHSMKADHTMGCLNGPSRVLLLLRTAGLYSATPTAAALLLGLLMQQQQQAPEQSVHPIHCLDCPHQSSLYIVFVVN